MINISKCLERRHNLDLGTCYNAAGEELATRITVAAYEIYPSGGIVAARIEGTDPVRIVDEMLTTEKVWGGDRSRYQV